MWLSISALGKEIFLSNILLYLTSFFHKFKFDTFDEISRNNFLKYNLVFFLEKC